MKSIPGSKKLQEVSANLLGAGVQAGVWQHIETQVASSDANLDFVTGFDGDYDYYQILISHLLPATDGTHLYIQVSEDNGSTWKSGAGDYRYVENFVSFDSTEAFTSTGYASETALAMLQGIGNGANEGIRTLTIQLNRPNDTGYTAFSCQGSAVNAGLGIPQGIWAEGEYWGSTNAVNALRFLFASGNIASGTITLMGMKVPT